MSPGVLILVGILGTFAVVGLLQWLAARAARRAEGEPTPDLPGPLGQSVKGSTLLWFHSPTCAPCKVMEPHVHALAEAGKAHVVDVMESPAVAQAFGVMATPTTIRIVDGTIAAVRLGVIPPDQLRAMAG